MVIPFFNAALCRLRRAIRLIFKIRPFAYDLLTADNARHNRLRGDLVPAGTRVIVQDGRVFVATDEDDDLGVCIFREDYRTYVHFGWD